MLDTPGKRLKASLNRLLYGPKVSESGLKNVENCDNPCHEVQPRIKSGVLPFSVWRTKTTGINVPPFSVWPNKLSCPLTPLDDVSAPIPACAVCPLATPGGQTRHLY